MKRALWQCLVLVLAVASLSGCALSRRGVTGLSKAEGTYYTDLRTYLQRNRQTLDSGLTLQLAADRARQRNILDWQRDLQHAEVILEQRTPDVTGEQRLLEFKLAELDLAAVGNVQALQGIDEARKQAILELYDNIVKAVAALEKNNTTILAYLESNDASFLLRSLDIDGIFRVVGDIQQARAELAHTDAQAQAQQQKQIESAQQAVERARDLLIKVYSK
jgi:hypothetical protein